MQWNEFRSHLKHLSAKDHKRIEEAFTLGEAMHAGQKRKSGEPYYNHPIAVADMLAARGINLPCATRLTEDDVDYSAGVIREALGVKA